MKRQRGAAVVEFALVVILTITLLFGMIELGRAFFTWNTAVDATRRGARTASIVAVGDTAAVLEEMKAIMGQLEASNVAVDYSIDGVSWGNACVRGTCRFVRVQIAYDFYPAVFFLPETISMPPFATVFPVEALGAV